MAAKIDGKLVEPNELGVWIRSDEKGEDSKNVGLKIKGGKSTKLIPVSDAVKNKDGVWIDSKSGKPLSVDKKGDPVWYFMLEKGSKTSTGKKGTDTPAAYDPYWHTSRSPLNDQFKSAWIRPNIVIVECEVPVSELSSGYWASHAKYPVGEVDWKSGSVSSAVYEQTGRARKVILSRWCKPVRVISDSEFVKLAKEYIGDAKVVIPENVVTPKQRVALEAAGLKIGAPEKGVNKSEQIFEALKAGLLVDNSLKEHRAQAGSTIKDWGHTPKNLRMNESQLTDDIMQFAGNVVTKKLSEAGADDVIAWNVKTNGNWYFFRVDQDYNIMVDYAIPADQAHFEEFKEIIKDYGIDTRTDSFHGIMQKLGFHDGLYRNLSEYFRQRRNPKFSALDRGTDRRVGELRQDSNRTIDGDSQKDSKETGGTLSFFKTKDGEVYGFTDGKKIYLDLKKMKADTPLHEYGHLWVAALQRLNPKEWENVKGLFDQVEGLKEEIQKAYPELEGDDLYEEMITTYSGRKGAEKLEAEAKRIAADEGKELEDSAKAKGFVDKVRDALKRYWKGVADLLGIKFTNADEVADKILADWADGVDPRKLEGKKEEKGGSPEDGRDLPGNGGEGGEGPTEPAGNLVGGLHDAALDYKRGQGEKVGQSVEQTPEEKAAAREKEMQEHPLTMEEIDSYDTGDAEADAFAKEYAKGYLAGKVNPMTVFYYNQIYEHVRNTRQDSKGNSGTADTAHVDGGSDESGQPGGGGEPTEPVDKGTGEGDVSGGGQNAGTDGPERAATADGGAGNQPVGGEAPKMDGVSDSTQRPRRGSKSGGKDGTDGQQPAQGNGGGTGETKSDAQAAYEQSEKDIERGLSD